MPGTRGGCGTYTGNLKGKMGKSGKETSIEEGREVNT